MDSYGKELILDLHDCDPSTYKNREVLGDFIDQLCDLIQMEQGPRHWWDYAGYPTDYAKAPPHLKGTSVVQFIMTSTIVIHALDDLHQVYINIFSCKDFDTVDVTKFAVEWFKAEVIQKGTVLRK